MESGWLLPTGSSLLATGSIREATMQLLIDSAAHGCCRLIATTKDTASRHTAHRIECVKRPMDKRTAFG
jgi:hypothetical protein